MGCFEIEIDIKEFEEFDLSEGSGSVGAGEQLAALTNEKLKTSPKLSYGMAFSEVQIEHPDLAAEHRLELHNEATRLSNREGISYRDAIYKITKKK